MDEFSDEALVVQLSREALYELVWTMPVQKVAQQFEVSGVWVGKVCRSAGIPLPPRGYWAKVQSGKPVERVALPPAARGDADKVTIRNGYQPRPQLDLQEVKKAISSSREVPVPLQLRDPHAFVAASRQAAEAAKPEEDGRVNVRGVPRTFNIRVSRHALGRSLRILQAICDEAGRRGWEIGAAPADRSREASSGFLKVGAQTYQVSIEERTEPIPFSDEDVREWRRKRSPWVDRDYPLPQERKRRLTGELILQVPSSYDGSRTRWSDGKRARVEEQLPDFFATMEIRAKKDEEKRLLRKREEEEWKARARLQRIEKARAARLTSEVTASLQADQIRAYITKVRARLQSADATEVERLTAWCDWAERYADRLDPAATLSLITGLDDDRDGWGW